MESSQNVSVLICRKFSLFFNSQDNRSYMVSCVGAEPLLTTSVSKFTSGHMSYIYVV